MVATGFTRPDGSFDADAYRRSLEERLEQDRNAYQKKLGDELGKQRVFWQMGLTAEDARACLQEGQGHFVGLDRHMDRDWQSLNIYPSLSAEQIRSMEGDVTAAIGEYLRLPDELPPMDEVRDFLEQPVRFEQIKTAASVPAHTRCTFCRRLPRDLLNTITNVLRSGGIRLREQNIEALSYDSTETMQAPFSLALRTNGNLRAWIVRDGQRTGEIVELAYNTGNEFYVETGERIETGEKDIPWVPAVTNEKSDAVTNAPVYRIEEGVPPTGVWVQFCLREGTTVKKEERGSSYRPSQMLFWRVHAKNAKQAQQVVKHYGRYFHIQFEPAERPAPAPRKPPPPPPPKTEVATMSLPFKQREPKKSSHEPPPAYKPNRPPPPSSTSVHRKYRQENKGEEMAES